MTSPTHSPSTGPATAATALPSTLPSTSPTSTPAVSVTHHATVIETSLAAPSLNAVAFARDAIHGWIGGDGLIAATSDGGKVWQKEWSGDRIVTEIEVLDPLHVWVLAGVQPPGDLLVVDTLLRTTDGGQHWNRTTLHQPLGQVDMLTPSSAWAIQRLATADGGQFGRLVHTSDAGATWQANGNAATDAVCFADRLHGYAAGTRLRATTDGGRTWVLRAKLPDEGLPMALGCSGSALWLFVNLDGGAGGHVNYAGYRSTDGGRHLTQVLGNRFYPGTPAGIASAGDEPGPFVAVSSTAAVEVGTSPAAETSSVTTTSDGGRHWTTTALEDVPSESVSVSFPTALRGFVTANVWDRGELLTTTDGGRSWHEIYPTASAGPVADLSFVSASEGFGLGVPGDAAAIVHSTDGGKIWSLVADLPEAALVLGSGPAYPLLSFVDRMHGWAAGANGHLFATVDGGVEWSKLEAPAATPFVSGVTFVDPQRGCILASTPDRLTNVELRTGDGGGTWQPIGANSSLGACALGDRGSALDDQALVATYPADVIPAIVSHGDAAWALGAHGLARSLDGGLTWDVFDWSPAQEDFAPTSLSFGDPRHGWFMTEMGMIFATQDGGQTWSALP
jgi:photosystem II stability/assembly factor-like uncharacterized protein